MFDTNNPIIKHKTGLLNLVQELGNVSKACKVMGVSRDTFYQVTFRKNLYDLLEALQKDLDE